MNPVTFPGGQIAPGTWWLVEGDRVRDTRTGARGRVHLLDLTPADLAAGCAHAEIVWDDMLATTELDLAAAHGLTLTSTDTPGRAGGERS